MLENVFVILFYFYDQYFKVVGLDIYIEEMLVDSDFVVNLVICKVCLVDFKDCIKVQVIDL